MFLVSPPPRVSAEVELALTFDRVATLGVSAEDRERLRSLLEARLGVPVVLSEDDGGLLLSARVGYSRLGELSGFTGVSSAQLELVGSGEEPAGGLLTVTLVDPTELRELVVEGAAGQPDSAALAAALLASHLVTVDVTFPGEILSVVTPSAGTRPEVSGSTARVAQPLGDFRSGQLLIAGRLVPPAQESGASWLYTVFPAVAVVLVALVAFARRRGLL